MGKTSRCHRDIQYLCEKPLMSDKISVGKTIDVIYKYDIYGENKSMSYKNTIYMGKTIDVLRDIYRKNHWCHIKIRYLWEKPLMRYKNSIYMWKTSRCHRKMPYLWAKPLMWYQIRYIWGKPSMSYKYTISMGKIIDVL